MNYQEFKNVFQKAIIIGSKKALIEKIAKHPERYIGLFRPTKPKTKIIQNLTHSNEIRFGDAFENIIEKYLLENQYKILEKKVVFNEKNLKLDQIIKRKNRIIFVEQKIRDDHDSSKKRGQIDNFKKKIQALKNQYKDKTLIGYFYFIDPSLKKNTNYYKKRLKELTTEHEVELHLAYGKDFFDNLGLSKIWDEIKTYLSQWKQELPELLNTNFDSESESTFQEIKDIKKNTFKKFFDNESIIKDICPILFPEKKVLKLLRNYFKNQANHDYDQITKKIDTYLR